MFCGCDVALRGQSGGIDTSMPRVEYDLSLVEERLWYALLGEKLVDMLLPTRLDIREFYQVTP